MSEGGNQYQSEFTKRIAAARTWKSYIELDLKECYFLSAPNRQRQINSQTTPATQRMLDAPELNTDYGYILCQDFVTEMMNAFLPEAEEWCERGPGMDFPDGAWDKVKDLVKKDDSKIFGAIKASNFYPEFTKAVNPDLAIGTAALWIDRPHGLHKPITCSAVPLRELEIDLGPYGEIDFRAAVRFSRNHYVKELVGDEVWAKMPEEMTKKLTETKPQDRTQVTWAFWRDWADQSDEVWIHTIAVGNTVVFDKKFKGEGSCPLIPFRFNPTADWPHGSGPLLQGLPTLRQMDEFKAMRVQQASLSINPPITYPDDSFAAVEQGVEEGMAYPIRPGTEGAVKPIYIVPPPEAANFQYQEMMHDLRKLFFVDQPEQTGDTPPTLGQWLDELARAQRRIGTPGLPFWREGPAQFFLRFKYLLELSGAIAPVRVDGKAITAMPRNPAQAAAEQQELAKAMQVLTYIIQTMPEEGKIGIDGTKTIKNFVEKARVSSIIVMRKAEDVQKAIEQMSKLVFVPSIPILPSSGMV